LADANVEAPNHALRDIPQDRVRIHMCRGNYKGPMACDIPMARIFDTLMSARARYVLFKAPNPRHGHEWRGFRDRRHHSPDGKILVPGVVDTTTDFVEHPELVAQWIQRFTDTVGTDRVIAGSDCSFESLAGFGAVGTDITCAKLHARQTAQHRRPETARKGGFKGLRGGWRQVPERAQRQVTGEGCPDHGRPDSAG